MPSASNQRITIDNTNTGTTYIGDDNQFTFAPGAWTLGLSGLHNSVTGGTGTNTYVMYSTASNYLQANSLTTGSGDSIISLSGDYTQATVSAPTTVRAAVAGNNTSLVTNDGTVTDVVFGNFNSITGGAGADTFLLNGTGNVASLGSGPSAVGIAGDGLITGGTGTDTFAFLAGSSATGPTINSYAPGRDHLSILMSTGFSAGLTDSGLSPQAFLTSSQLENGAGPTQASTRFVYNPSSGVLSYTPYGSGSGASTPVATLPTGLTLSASDIFISNRYVYAAPVQNTLDSLPAAWGVTDPQATAANADNFGAVDQTTGVSSEEPGQAYSGPVTYLTQQFTYGGSHRVTVTARTNNVFIKGSGNEALAALGGQNVLDGGLGSNFLVGGSGTDTFFTDARTSAFVWNTIVNFHPGDMVTLWGFVGGQSTYALTPSEGAAGYQGLTLNADLQGNGQVTAKVTLAGMTTADLSHLTFTPGTVAGIPYLGIVDH